VTELQKIVEEKARAAFQSFPEERYLPSGQRKWKHLAINERGRDKMGETSVVIWGLARDVADVLPATLARIEKLGEMFGDYQAVIYENDSADATRHILEEWSDKNGKATCIFEDRDDPVNPQTRDMGRVDRMAYYRNQCRKFVAEEYGEHPYSIIVDMDLPGGWSYEGVANTFGHIGWDMVGSNGIFYDHPAVARLGHPLYFDVFALRIEDYTPIDGTVGNLMHWEPGSELVPVKSCFGGLGVYNMEAMRRCSYSGGDCEHVPFHRQMSQQGMSRLFLNPSQIVLY
jgi:hypothetical protein